MLLSGPIDSLPLWGVFTATVVLVLLSIESGYWLGRYRRQRSEEEKEGPVGGIVTATLGLLGFILAFTFGMAATRFDARRQIVVEEANAIGTTYLRAGLLPNDQGVKIHKLLKEYVDTRLEAVAAKDLDTALRHSENLHRELWREAETVGKEHADSIMVGLYIQSLNETIDVFGRRMQVANRNRIPGVLWDILYLITILTMAGVGYHGGLTKSKRSLAILILVMTFSAIILLVADLDRPHKGFLTVSQQAMVDLRNTMNDTP
jgi:hypothetical protein